MMNPKEDPDLCPEPENTADNIEATSRMLRTLLPTCPACQTYTEGHSFAQIASAIVSDSRKSELANLFGSVRQHAWERLLQFGDFDIESDALVVYIVKGDHPNGFIAAVMEPFELYAKNDVVLLESITATDIVSISNLTTLKWRRM
jgi:hypothetical protein